MFSSVIVSYLPNFAPHMFPLISSNTVSTTLSHPTPACPLVTFSCTVLPAMAGNLCWGCPLLYVANSFSRTFCLEQIPSSSLNAVLLVILEISTICFISSCPLYSFQLFGDVRVPFPCVSCSCILQRWHLLHSSGYIYLSCCRGATLFG